MRLYIVYFWVDGRPFMVSVIAIRRNSCKTTRLIRQCQIRKEKEKKKKGITGAKIINKRFLAQPLMMWVDSLFTYRNERISH